MEDLTKLSGPELADKLESVNVRVDLLEPNAWAGANVFNEACRRLREDTREWQRNLERERDGLRTELAAVKAELHKWRNGHQLQAFQEDLNEMLGRATDAERERDGLLVERGLLQQSVSRLHTDLRAWDDQCSLLQNTVKNQRKELHSLNVERKATLTKLEDAQRRIAELEAEAKAYHEHMAKWEAQIKADAAALAGAAQPPSSREPGCQCHWEVGDSPCRVHGEDEPEPAERKAQEERRYGRIDFAPLTLGKLIGMHHEGSPHYEALIHLRETLATLDAVKALADGWASLETMTDAKYAGVRLREVLNGKR